MARFAALLAAVGLIAAGPATVAVAKKDDPPKKGKKKMPVPPAPVVKLTLVNGEEFLHVTVPKSKSKDVETICVGECIRYDQVSGVLIRAADVGQGDINRGTKVVVNVIAEKGPYSKWWVSGYIVKVR
jgi:hypothetical protein